VLLYKHRSSVPRYALVKGSGSLVPQNATLWVTSPSSQPMTAIQPTTPRCPLRVVARIKALWKAFVIIVQQVAVATVRANGPLVAEVSRRLRRAFSTSQLAT
jgi:hypothetical protein